MILQTNFNVGDTVHCIIANEIETRRNGQTTGKSFEYEIIEARVHGFAAYTRVDIDGGNPTVSINYYVHEPSWESYFVLGEFTVKQEMVFQSRKLAEEKFNELTTK